MLVTAGSGETLTAVVTQAPYLTANVSSPGLTVIPNSAANMQIIVPGETPAPGKWNNGQNPMPYGKLNTPSQCIAGVPFTVTVNLVDNYWNVVPQNGTSAAITGTDPYFVLPSSAALTLGTTTFRLALVTSGSDSLNPSSWTITATNVSNNTQYNTSPNITVAPNSPVRLEVIVPGETAAPGKTFGLAGKLDVSTPTVETAGINFNAEVRGVDNWWNVVNDNTPVTLRLTTRTPHRPYQTSRLLTAKRR